MARQTRELILLYQQRLADLIEIIRGYGLENGRPATTVRGIKLKEKYSERLCRLWLKVARSFCAGGVFLLLLAEALTEVREAAAAEKVTLPSSVKDGSARDGKTLASQVCGACH